MTRHTLANKSRSHNIFPLQNILDSVVALYCPKQDRSNRFQQTVLVTNTVCWKRFERSCFGQYSATTLSKMFCRGKILWERLLFASVCRVITAYNITSGVLALDGTENKRSKNTKALAKVHKMKDK